MPDREVKTIRDLIYFQYAKIVGKSAFGPDAKKTAYGFIKTTFRDFVHDEKKWSDIDHDSPDENTIPMILNREGELSLICTDKACAYCGSTSDLQWEHIVPRSLSINDRCPTCERIQGIHNQVWACAKCNGTKKTDQDSPDENTISMILTMVGELSLAYQRPLPIHPRLAPGKDQILGHRSGAGGEEIFEDDILLPCLQGDAGCEAGRERDYCDGFGSIT